MLRSRALLNGQRPTCIDDGFEPTLHWDLLDTPRRWKRPRVIFVNSMSDLFQEEVPLDFIRRAFATMAACPQHTFQILTKRAERLAHVAHSLPWPANVWMGVSVESSRVRERTRTGRREK